jgi:hypothetical protein
MEAHAFPEPPLARGFGAFIWFVKLAEWTSPQVAQNGCRFRRG